MNLLSLAEKLAGEAPASLTYNVGRCLHTGDKFASCAACVEACPTAAIQPGAPPQLQAEACEHCFACLPACPTGAFAQEDELPHLLRCLARLQIDTLELICEKHPAPDLGVGGNSAAIQVRGCLAGLGAAAYLQLAATSLHSIVLRADACAGCPWRSLPAQVAQQAAQAQEWLERLQRPDFLTVISAESAAVMPLEPRPLHRAGAPPVSRRDLLRGRVQPPPPVDVTSSLNPYHQRLRLLKALQKLAPREALAGLTAPADSGFAHLSVADSCSACGVCARACPTTALLLETDEQDRFQLTFSLQACLACDACMHLCPEEAIALHREVPLERILDLQTDEIVLQGDLAQCKRCNARYAAAALQDGLCTVCHYRRANPFGSFIPATAPGRAGRSGASQ